MGLVELTNWFCNGNLKKNVSDTVVSFNFGVHVILVPLSMRPLGSSLLNAEQYGFNPLIVQMVDGEGGEYSKMKRVRFTLCFKLMKMVGIVNMIVYGGCQLLRIER